MGRLIRSDEEVEVRCKISSEYKMATRKDDRGAARSGSCRVRARRATCSFSGFRWRSNKAANRFLLTV